MHNSSDNNRIIVALDFDSEVKAMALISQLSPKLCRLKIGKAMFTRLGRDFVKRVIDLGFDVFLDLKFHDIPAQVGLATRAAADLGVWMMTLHASGGEAMMRAAMQSIAELDRKPIVVAVTVLTSMNENDWRATGHEQTPAQGVERLAQLAHQSQVDGIVCSAEEVAAQSRARPDWVYVTPGIRLAENQVQSDDQQRIMTPSAAIAAGSSYLVIGRPITQAENPLSVLEQITSEIKLTSQA